MMAITAYLATLTPQPMRMLSDFDKRRSLRFDGIVRGTMLPWLSIGRPPVRHRAPPAWMPSIDASVRFGHQSDAC